MKKPVHKVLGGFLLSLRCLGVYAHKVFGADAQPLLFLTLNAGVNGQEFYFVLFYNIARNTAYLRPSPVSVLNHGALTERKLSHGLVAYLGTQQLGVCCGIVDIQVKKYFCSFRRIQT